MNVPKVIRCFSVVEQFSQRISFEETRKHNLHDVIYQYHFCNNFCHLLYVLHGFIVILPHNAAYNYSIIHLLTKIILPHNAAYNYSIIHLLTRIILPHNAAYNYSIIHLLTKIILPHNATYNYSIIHLLTKIKY